MFHYPGKKTNPTSSKPLHDLVAIASPSVLLAEGRRPALIQNIAESSALDSATFDQLCLKLIQNYTHYCQRLPETANRYYALPGGLLDHALNRTEAAMHLLRCAFVQGAESAVSEEQTLWLYALFSAGILQGIGKLKLDYQIELFDSNGRLLKAWNPLLENLTATARYYHYEFTQGGEDDLRCRLNLLLAYQLMPEAGFAWIAGNPEVLAAWLALINEDRSAAGMLSAILERADAIAIQHDLTQFLHKHPASASTTTRPGRISTFIDAAPESTIEKDHLMGAEFIKWLTQELKNGKFCMNKIPVMMIPAGIVISTELFMLFMREHPEIRNWQAVQKGLISLGLHHHEPEKQRATGQLVLEKYAVVLPDTLQLYNPTTDKETTVSAVDLMCMQQTPEHPEPLHYLLSLTGKWQASEDNTPEPQAGFSHRD